MPTTTQPSPGELVAQRTISAYTLAPEQLRKSEGLHRTSVVLSLSSTLLGFAVILVLILVRFGPRVQRVAETLSRRRLVQAFIFVPTLLLTLSLFDLPLGIYGHHLSRAYGLSVQGWGSWFADEAKAALITFVFATLCAWGLYALIRRSPRRWWFYGWLLTLPITVLLVFVAPVLLDPIFNHFEPLARTNPELTTQLRSLAHSSGLEIPESRIFLMRASDKVTTYNAYVTGIGSTKRIVVWDNTARDLTLPQTLFVFGHEMGHYVLHHIYLGLAFSAFLTLIGFYLTYRLVLLLLARFGQTLGVHSLEDWSSLPLLLLIASLLSFVSSPIASSFSRWEEHSADVYGLAVTRPITPNASQVAAQAFQLLGEKSYSYPHPSPFLVFWSYSHPPIADRIQFVLNSSSHNK
jgi:Zn-dependent protease with chaperone function